MAVYSMKDSLEIAKDNNSSWRLKGFSDDCEMFGQGVKTFSPGWFMQAQDVSLTKSSSTFVAYI
jgi:hypothetical protein